MIPIRYWRMALGNITPKASDRDVEVQKISQRYKRSEDGSKTDILEGYNIEFLANKGCSQTVKLPLTAKESVGAIEKAMIDKQAIIRVKLLNLELHPYALRSNSTGELLTGISATADGAEITSIEKPEIDDDLVDFEELT